MLRPNPILQGYLQITTGIFAFVFAAVALVRFQGTQDRNLADSGIGFLLSGATLIASSILFFSADSRVADLVSVGARCLVDQPAAAGPAFLRWPCWWSTSGPVRAIRRWKSPVDFSRCSR